MAVVVVGGHSRNIGKTSVVAGLISALRRFHWTAIKITQYGHGVCSANGEPCDCETADHTIAVSEEHSLTSGTDSSRYLASGANRSFWVRTRQGQLSDAMPAVRKVIASHENVIIESNSILRFLQPLVAVSVLDPGVSDFKASALRYLDRVNAIVLPLGAKLDAWPQVSPNIMKGKPMFSFVPPSYCTPELAAFVASRVEGDHRFSLVEKSSEASCELSS